MRIHEFGTEHEKTVLLLHSACLSWRMFQPAAERLQTQYHLIIPALPAHDPDEKTPYTSVEAIAAELGDWLAQRGISTLWGLYGVSMGGAVALRLLADGKVAVRTCVLDAAITPYRAPRWLTRGFSLRNYLVIRFAQRHLALIRRAFPAQRFGQAAVEDVCMILGRMDRRDVWRVFDSCFHYPLPKRLQTAARLLRTTSDSVLHIAVAVGYTGTSQFDSAFKALYHMTPAQYRKWCRENNVQNR